MFNSLYSKVSPKGVDYSIRGMAGVPKGSCCSSSSLGWNRGVDVVFEHRRVAAPVYPVSNNETADSTFRGRYLRLTLLDDLRKYYFAYSTQE